jgi:AcrR family transcriptional regulator
VEKGSGATPSGENRTEERVLAAAVRLFAIRGFEGTSIREIAKEAGISVATLYHYIDTKEDLLSRMMNLSMRRLLDQGARALEASSDPTEQMIGLVDIHVRKHAQENLLSAVGDTEVRSLSPSRRREIVALRDAYQKMWEEVISEGVKKGRFAVSDVKLAALALLEMCTGVAHWYAPAGRLSLDQVSKAFVDMALSLLGAGGPGPGGRMVRNSPTPREATPRRGGRQAPVTR